MKSILVLLFLVTFWVAPFGLTPSKADEPCVGTDSKALSDEATALTKQLNDLRAAVADREQKITLLKLMVSQKDESLQWFTACVSAGIMPDATCEVNLINLTVSKKVEK